MTQNPSRLRNVAIACLVSGILAGLLSASQCQRAESDCPIAALQYLSSDAASWALWLHWVNWLPGAVFGVLFAVAALKPTATGRARRVGLYALVSAAAYVVAGLVFSGFLAYASADEFRLIVWVWPAGFSAGLLGALVLAMGGNRFLRRAGSAGGMFHRSWLPALVGGIAGILFVWACIYGEQQPLVAFPLAFSIWQIAVGLSLARGSAAAGEAMEGRSHSPGGEIQ